MKERTVRLLRWSERYTKTDMVYLAKGGFWLTFGTVFTGAISLITMYMFANYMPKNMYGIYQYLLAMLSIITITSLAGMNVSATRSIAQGFDQTLISLLKVKFKWSLLGSLGALTVGTYYLLQENLLLGFGFYILSLIAPFWGNLGIYVSYLQAKKRFAKLTLYDITLHSILAITLVITLLLTNNPLIILAAYIAPFILLKGVFLLSTLRKIDKESEVDPKAKSYGWHLTGMTAFGTILVNTDKILLWHILGPISVASYIFSTSIPIKLADMLRTINRLAFPKFAQTDTKDAQNGLLPKIIKLSVTSVIIMGAYVFTAPWIFEKFFPLYVDVVWYTQLASLIIILQPFNLIATYLSAKAYTKELYIAQISSPIIRIILMILLILTFKLAGAIFAFIISRIVDVLLLLILYLYRNSR